MSQINLLSKEVSELIAAGEVIENPAAIVKELTENAIDAGANLITVEIQNGGRTYLRVSDNGSGISESDVQNAFLRHATSKISEKKDLESILTLGFRGEALASISAVAKVDLLTKPAADEYGTHYIIEGGAEKVFEKSGCPDGTTFVVRDLFYNIPARLKFLGSDTSEANKIANLVTKLSLSHPEISFKFIRDNKPQLLTAGDGKLYSGIYSVYGRDFASSLIPVDYTWNGVRVWGFTVKPLLAKPNRKFQNFFVNSRYVTSKTMITAIEEAYRNSIMTGRFPACVICIQVAPNIVDVNVHPTKIAVKFSDDKLIYEAIYFAVKDSLLKQDKPVEMKLETKRRFTDSELYDFPEKPQGEQLSFNEPVQQSMEVAQSADLPKVSIPVIKSVGTIKTVVPAVNKPVDKPVSKASDLFISSLNSKADSNYNNKSDEIQREIADSVIEVLADKYKNEGSSDASEFKYISNESFEKKEVVVDEPEKRIASKPVVVGELFKTFIVAQQDDEMLLFDKHAAHERYIFEKIKGGADELDTQMFLEPIIVLLSYDEFDALSANIEQVQKLGFAIEPDLAPNVMVKGVPMILGDENPSEIVSQLAKNFVDCKHNPQLEIFNELYHSIACKAAIKANDISSIVELQALVNMIYDRDDIKYCPHGRPVMIKLTKKDIEKQFKRIV